MFLDYSIRINNSANPSCVWGQLSINNAEPIVQDYIIIKITSKQRNWCDLMAHSSQWGKGNCVVSPSCHWERCWLSFDNSHWSSLAAFKHGGCWMGVRSTAFQALVKVVELNLLSSLEDLRQLDRSLSQEDSATPVSSTAPEINTNWIGYKVSVSSRWFDRLSCPITSFSTQQLSIAIYM